MAALLVLFWSAVAFAQPSPELAQWVKDSLQPGARALEDGKFHSACSPHPVRITGKDPVTKEARAVKVSVYDSASADPRDVLLLPPTGGENYIDRSYAAALCAVGARVTILESWEGDTERELDLGTYDRSSIRTLAAAEHVLEYLNPRHPVSILGTSLGALGAAFILGFDERVSTGVLIVGGDHLSEIIARTDEPGAAQIRANQMQANGIKTADEFELALRAAIHVDPGTFADYSGPKRLHFYVGKKDTTVPTRNQRELVKAFGYPRVDEYDGDHFRTIVATYWYHQAEIVSFLTGASVKKAQEALLRLRGGEK